LKLQCPLDCRDVRVVVADWGLDPSFNKGVERTKTYLPTYLPSQLASFLAS